VIITREDRAPPYLCMSMYAGATLSAKLVSAERLIGFQQMGIVMCTCTHIFLGELGLKRPVNLLLDYEAYEHLRKLALESGTSVSEMVNDYIRSKVAELRGGNMQLQAKAVSYEGLKSLHTRLVKEVDALERRLTKRKVYDELVGFAGQKGLNLETLANLEDTMPKMLSEWKGLPEDMHQFITLLETVKRKRQVEEKLAEIRKQNAQAMLLPSNASR